MKTLTKVELKSTLWFSIIVIMFVMGIHIGFSGSRNLSATPVTVTTTYTPTMRTVTSTEQISQSYSRKIINRQCEVLIELAEVTISAKKPKMNRTIVKIPTDEEEFLNTINARLEAYKVLPNVEPIQLTSNLLTVQTIIDMDQIASEMYSNLNPNSSISNSTNAQLLDLDTPQTTNSDWDHVYGQEEV